MPAQLPVTLVTGFLGAGKTTLIYRLASARHRERIGAIVGDVVGSAIDADLLAAVVEVVEPVSPGVSGRTGRPQLLRAVAAMGACSPALDRIVIEACGLDDPTPLLGALERHGGAVRVDAVIAVVDAAQPPADIGCSDALRQIEVADQVVVSKGDLVSDRERARVCAYVRALNPGAELLAGAGHMLDSQPLLERLSYHHPCDELPRRPRGRSIRRRPRPRRAGRG